MTNLLETRISDISSSDIQTLVGDLCNCTGLSKAEFNTKTLRFMLMAIILEAKECLSEKYLLGPGILTKKVGDLPHGSAVYHVCVELAALNRTQIEVIDGNKVISFIKKCSAGLCPKLSSAKKLARNRLRHVTKTRLIMQRRQSGSL